MTTASPAGSSSAGATPLNSYGGAPSTAPVASTSTARPAAEGEAILLTYEIMVSSSLAGSGEPQPTEPAPLGRPR
jgi:hypothetical protein